MELGKPNMAVEKRSGMDKEGITLPVAHSCADMPFEHV